MKTNPFSQRWCLGLLVYATAHALKQMPGLLGVMLLLLPPPLTLFGQTGPGPNPSDGAFDDCFECTQVIGYSQVGAVNGWFMRDGVFESIVGNDRWQLLWNNGATLEDWQDPNHPYWTNALVSPCTSNSTAPDRVLLNLSARSYDTNVSAWASGIEATIDTIALKYPSVRRIVLQPIVGGPNHQLCDIAGQEVRASLTHPYMDEAIAVIVAARAGTQPEVVAGYSPEVRDCADYADALGHLTPDGAVAAAQAIGQYYAALDASCFSSPPCPAPELFIQLLSPSQAELIWEGCTNSAYHLFGSRNLAGWQAAAPPIPAPATAGWMTQIVSVGLARQYFQMQQLALTNSPVPAPPGEYGDLSIVSDGIPRRYRLTIPANYDPAEPAPLAFILHGHGQTSDSFAIQHPTLSQYASELGMLLVLPEGALSERGTGWFASDPIPGENNVDDVRFILALLERLATTLNIDRKRVYAGGFSNGGQMCHYLAGRTTNIFAAVAAVGSAVTAGRGSPTNVVYAPAPSVPIPALIVNATNDCALSYWGGLNEDGMLQPAVWEAVAHYTNANLCAQPPTLTTNLVATNFVSRHNADCGGPYPPPAQVITNLVIRETHFGCDTGKQVVLVTLTDGGHKWPDAEDRVGFDANREVLDFFRQHCNCDAPGALDPPAVPTLPGIYQLALCDQGFNRRFRLMIPTSYTGTVARPLVVALHGGGESVQQFALQHPDLFAKCNSEGVILALPEATIHPQSQSPLWGNKPFDIVVDDRVFFTNLLEHLAATLNVDRKRVYAAGFSNGGSFAHYLAASATNLLAAIAAVCTQTGWNDPVTGAIPAPPAPLEPMPVLMVRGTLDSLRPYNGGPNTDGILTRSAADDVAYWTSGNSCGPITSTNTIGTVTRFAFEACAGTSEVILIRVGGMPHLWPDAADGFGFDANVQVVNFLLQHTRP